MYKLHTQCRACGSSSLEPVVDYGTMPLANDFKRPEKPRSGWVPLSVLYCHECGLAQLSAVVDPSLLYTRYSYVSSDSETMLAHYGKLLDDFRTFNQGPLGNVLEIGSNDGRFLEFLKPHAKNVEGVESAENLAVFAIGKGIHTTSAFWNPALAKALGKFDLIVCRHVFAHVDDWESFLDAIALSSHEDTLIYIEVHDGDKLLELNEFDTIYHEHLNYVTPHPVMRMLPETGLYLWKVIHYPIHGGSIGLWIKKGTGKWLEQYRAKPNDRDRWKRLDDTSKKTMLQFRKDIQYLGGTKAKLCGYGAPAKSALWLNWCGLSKRQIEFVHDSTVWKQRCVCPGTDIPVIDGAQKMMESITHAILFAWNYEAEIVRKEQRFIKNGGQFLIPHKLLSAL